MKTMKLRELRQATLKLKQTLCEEGETLLVSNGEPIARLLPVEEEPARSKLRSLEAFRETLPKMKVPSEVPVREDRDRRGI